MVTLLDALASMLAPMLLKEGEKIAKTGMLAHLEKQMSRKKENKPVMVVDPAKLPSPATMWG